MVVCVMKFQPHIDFKTGFVKNKKIKHLRYRTSNNIGIYKK